MCPTGKMQVFFDMSRNSTALSAQSLSRVWLFATLWARLLCPWDSPGKSTGGVYHFLFQGIQSWIDIKFAEFQWNLIFYNEFYVKYALVLCCAKSLQSCPTPCDSMDSNPPGSSVHEIFQARILEGIAISSSRRSSWPKDQTCISYVSCIVNQVLYH